MIPDTGQYPNAGDDSAGADLQRLQSRYHSTCLCFYFVRPPLFRQLAELSEKRISTFLVFCLLNRDSHSTSPCFPDESRGALSSLASTLTHSLSLSLSSSLSPASTHALTHGKLSKGVCSSSSIKSNKEEEEVENELEAKAGRPATERIERTFAAAPAAARRRKGASTDEHYTSLSLSLSLSHILSLSYSRSLNFSACLFPAFCLYNILFHLVHATYLPTYLAPFFLFYSFVPKEKEKNECLR